MSSATKPAELPIAGETGSLSLSDDDAEALDRLRSAHRQFERELRRMMPPLIDRDEFLSALCCLPGQRPLFMKLIGELSRWRQANEQSTGDRALLSQLLATKWAWYSAPGPKELLHQFSSSERELVEPIDEGPLHKAFLELAIARANRDPTSARRYLKMQLWQQRVSSVTSPVWSILGFPLILALVLVVTAYHHPRTTIAIVVAAVILLSLRYL